MLSWQLIKEKKECLVSHSHVVDETFTQTVQGLTDYQTDYA